jgi:hypothetical protein
MSLPGLCCVLLPARVRMRLEVQLTPSAIGYVRVELGGRQIGMPEHFLNRSQICASLE